MAECCFVFRSIAAAAGAGVGGVALLGAGRCDYFCNVVMGMAECGNNLCLCFLAGAAGKGLYAIVVFACFGCYNAGIPAMTSC